jgi:hypothetical protein
MSDRVLSGLSHLRVIRSFAPNARLSGGTSGQRRDSAPRQWLFPDTPCIALPVLGWLPSPPMIVTLEVGAEIRRALLAGRRPVDVAREFGVPLSIVQEFLESSSSSRPTALIGQTSDDTLAMLRDTVTRLEASVASCMRMRQDLVTRRRGAVDSIMVVLDERLEHNTRTLKNLNDGLQFLRLELRREEAQKRAGL